MSRSDPADDDESTPGTRDRILAAAAELIAAGGRDAATTRAVAAAASVQAPTIYRLFGDKQGLLNAAAAREVAAYMAQKTARAPHPDPVQDLRDGWDAHVAFGLAHPGVFAIMHGEPGATATSPAIEAGLDVLRRRIRAIALVGRLRVSEERALLLLRSMGTGTVLTLLSLPEGARDPGLSETAREMMVAAITDENAGLTEFGPAGAAAALGSWLDRITALTPGERHLLGELLNRIADER